MFSQLRLGFNGERNSLYRLIRRASNIMWVVTCGVQFVSGAEPNSAIREEFLDSPLERGWETRGVGDLFYWNVTNQNLEVTWDSSFTNSYFRYPLGSTVTSEDDFGVSLELSLTDIAAGVHPGLGGTFQIAFGFQHRADADASDFVRGTGADTPNLVEFNFMPDTGFGPTVWPAMFPTNGAMNYSGNGDFAIFDLPVGVKMDISLNYSASNHTVVLTIQTNGVVVGSVVDAPLVAAEKGFRLDAFSISSYSEAGQGEYGGSILAHGVIDNISISLPPSPIGSSTGRFAEGRWEQEVTTREGWSYVLEGTANFQSWGEASEKVDGTGGTIQLIATGEESATHRFFRVKAARK